MKITITREQLETAGASESCIAYVKFIQEFGDKVEIEWSLEKQLEMLSDPVWRQVLGRCWWKGILPAWSMIGVDLSGASLFRADLRLAYLNEVNLSGAYLNEVNLSGAYLGWAYLGETNLSEADLGSANLNRADLRGADLKGANLSEANLSWANLSEANLSWAKLGGANLSGVNLKETNLSNITSDEYTVWPKGFEPGASLKPLKIDDRLFNDAYDLLDRVAENVGDTLWAMPEGSAVHMTAHEALIDLAARYDEGIAKELQARLERDCEAL